MKKSIIKGFTLIELLVVIAIIGLLASILLVSIGGARDDAKEAAVLSQMKSAQIAVTRCLFKNKVMYCRGKTETGTLNCNDTGDGAAVQSAGHFPAFKNSGSIGAPYYFEDGSALCGSGSATSEDTSIGFWPDITKYGYRYGVRADSDVGSGKFAFYAFKYDADLTASRSVVCCTQKGCAVSTRTGADMAFFNAAWPTTNFCLQDAGFAFDAANSNRAIGD